MNMTATDRESTSPTTGLSRIMRLWKPHSMRLIAGLLIAELAVVASLTLMGQTGTRLTGAATGTGIGLGAGYFLLRVAGGGQIILRYLERYYTHDAMFRALADLRVWFYRRLARGAALGLGFQRSGDLLSRLVSDVQTLDNLYLRIIVPLSTAILTWPIVTFICLKTGSGPGLVIAILFFLLVIVLPAATSRLSRSHGSDILRAKSALRVAALDLTVGLREARAFGAEDALVNTVIQREEQLFAAQKRQTVHMTLMQGVAGILAKIGVAAVLCALGGIFFRQAAPVVGITALFVAISALNNITGLSRAGLLTGQVRHAANRISEIVDRAPATVSGMKPAPANHEITLENITFRWSQKRAPVLKGLSLTLREGERTALIGPSGAGKSSIAALILKVVPPEQGRILFGGHDIQDIRDDDLRTKIAWLSQASHLFDDTIRGNLLLERTDIPDDRLWDALERAQIAQTVRDLPNGLDTWIGESGSKLSGGQGRRIALARVLLSDAPVLILDEPATGLDADTERAFIETLNKAAEGRTVLLIVHRLTGAERLDRIWRLDHGQAIAYPC